ncbi:Transforming growth factor beta-2 [Stylophora pistillata]|uniref:Transforming growth factor beta-2 n=1 Tax=Stylophora pistillata TaxID=50429 RepID=A0A2B4RJ07_STYPI|nr:Transforming growth factor beta-2 [Stylophora pistillata]
MAQQGRRTLELTSRQRYRSLASETEHGEENVSQGNYGHSAYSGVSNAESTSEENDTVISVWTEFDNIARKHRGNFKIGHINVNSVGGFKFYEIKTWLLSGRFDVLVISETKTDASFPDSQFHIDGYRLCRKDRQAGGRGLMIYVRSDVYFMTVRQLEGMSLENFSTFKTEFMVLKIKLGKGWITVVGVYRPPSVPKSRWINELSSLFEAVAMLSDTVFYAGDFKADLLDPDKPPKDGRSFLDLLDIFDLNCLITKATRKTKTTETLFDLILTNNKTKTLTSGVVDTQISDHSLVFTVLRSVAPRSRSRKICFRSLKNFNQEKFVQDLRIAPFTIMNLFDDVNDKLFAFEQLYNDILEEHAPLKQTIVRGNQVPYMNEQWRKAIRHRNKLWRKFTKDRTDTNYEQYKIHRNKCTSLRRKAIKEHFLKKSTSSENPRARDIKCRSTSTKTVTVMGPNGARCVEIIDVGRCAGSCSGHAKGECLFWINNPDESGSRTRQCAIRTKMRQKGCYPESTREETVGDKKTPNQRHPVGNVRVDVCENRRKYDTITINGCSIALDTNWSVSTEEKWISVDVTSVVQGWLDDSKTNHGLTVTVTSSLPMMNDWHVSPIYLGGGGPVLNNAENEDEEPWPHILAWFVPNERVQASKRKRRSLNSDYCRMRPKETRCCLRSLYVDFQKDLRWNWLHGPKGFYPNYCAGQCSFMWGIEKQNHHTPIMTLFNKINPSAPGDPCCVPKTYEPLVILYFKDGEPKIEELSNMAVSECVCL